jgi:membrane-bound lytic murein transglycosylase B
MSDLDDYGIVSKEPFNNDNLPITVIELPNQYKKEYWLGFHNFEVIKRYNPSDLYAMAVFQLSTYITTLRNKLNHG